MLKRDYPNEYMRLNEWVLNQYKSLIIDENLFSQFTIYIGQNAGSIPIPEELKLSVDVYNAALKYSSIRELEMISVVNEKQRLSKIESGSTSTEWQQGGASPSTEYPSDNKSCGENVNLFDKDDVTNEMYINRNSGVQETGCTVQGSDQPLSLCPGMVHPEV